MYWNQRMLEQGESEPHLSCHCITSLPIS